jgi:hypothetical protein
MRFDVAWPVVMQERRDKPKRAARELNVTGTNALATELGNKTRKFTS